uniref:Uncharacterized protein n=1 Tax=Xiphophorus couchianus TaxID=32473 RepID=A0A3B5MYF9_9TELE
KFPILITYKNGNSTAIYLVVLPVVSQVALLCQQVLPLEALDADPALLRGPLEAHGPQPAGNVSVDEAVSEVSIQLIHTPSNADIVSFCHYSRLFLVSALSQLRLLV